MWIGYSTTQERKWPFFLSSDRFIIPLSFFRINIRDMNSIKVRDEKKFEDLDALKDQIFKDISTAKEYFS